MKLGFIYLTPDQATSLRGGRRSEVLLTGVMRKHLPTINRVRARGEEIPFTAEAVESAIATLRDLQDDGLMVTSEKVYDLISLGKSLQQTIGGDTRGYDFRYIDWETPENNVFHLTEEYAVERSGSKDTYRPDIVLFINGIPMVVIECKPRGDKELQQAISQHLRNQREDGIPALYRYAQFLLSINAEAGTYGTVRTPAEFWAVWKERFDEGALDALMQRHLEPEQMAQLFWRRDDPAGDRVMERTITPQDRLLYCLCRPERILELTRTFVVYDAGTKKIARYQQYFGGAAGRWSGCASATHGKRRGGVVWHTQGSGKSLTMVMLAKARS